MLNHLQTSVAGGFDEEHFGSRIGFANLKMYGMHEAAAVSCMLMLSLRIYVEVGAAVCSFYQLSMLRPSYLL